MHRLERQAEKADRHIIEALRDSARSCDWHTHSIFRRCENGLTMREYLNGKSQDSGNA